MLELLLTIKKFEQQICEPLSQKVINASIFV